MLHMLTAVIDRVVPSPVDSETGDLRLTLCGLRAIELPCTLLSNLSPSSNFYQDSVHIILPTS